MATLISESQAIPNPGFSPWNVEGILNADNGKIVFKVTASSGDINYEGTAEEVTTFYRSLGRNIAEYSSFYNGIADVVDSINGDLLKTNQGSGASTDASGDTSVNDAEMARLKRQNDTANGTPVDNSKQEGGFLDDALKFVKKAGTAVAGFLGRGGFSPNSKDDVDAWLARSNPLHKFASYTYNLSLHALTVKDWAMLIQSPKSWVPSKTVIAGAGLRGIKGFQRDRNFEEDFYFDNLEFTAVIGPDGTNNATNSMNVKFTLIEPNGLTLLGRLQELASEPEMGMGGNYVQIPYVLEIRFVGYGDDGRPIAMPEHIKRIPLKIAEVQIKATHKGSEYQVTASPFGHQAFAQEIGSTPASFEVQASSLSDFFRPQDGDSGDTTNYSAEFTQRREAVKAAQDKVTQASKSRDNGAAPTKEDQKAEEDATTALTAANERLGGGGDNSYVVRSFISASNAWYKSLYDNKQADTYDEIYVKFADDILKKERIVQAQVQPVNQTPSTDRGAKGDGKSKKKTAQKRSGGKEQGPKLDAGKFPVAAGDHITKVINDCMMNSDYWRDQFEEPTEKNTIADQEAQMAQQNIPVRAWKIVPKLELKGWDQKKGRFAFKVTYFVLINIKHNRTMPNAPKTMPLTWVREYWYMFTGLNTDIISWDFTYNALYQNAVKVDNAKTEAVAGSTASGSDAEKDDADKADENVMTKLFKNIMGSVTGKSASSAGAGTDQVPTTNRMISNIQSQTGSNLNRDAKSAVAAAMYESIYSKAAEASEAKLKITGDPCFIKQDDLYHPPDSEYGGFGRTIEDYLHGEGQYLDPAGTITTDFGDVHVRLTWKSPVDFDTRTGLMATNGRYTVAGFSGIYSVREVICKFSQGKFEQDLTCVRVLNQEDFLRGLNSASSSNEDREQKTAPGMGIAATNAAIIAAITKPNADAKDGLASLPVGVGTDSFQDMTAGIRNSAKTFGPFGEEVVPQTPADVPYATPNNPVDKFNLPSGVTFDDANGVPSYKGNLYLGGQKDLASWKESIDAGQPFKYVVQADNGNAKVVST